MWLLYRYCFACTVLITTQHVVHNDSIGNERWDCHYAFSRWHNSQPEGSERRNSYMLYDVYYALHAIWPLRNRSKFGRVQQSVLDDLIFREGNIAIGAVEEFQLRRLFRKKIWLYAMNPCLWTFWRPSWTLPLCYRKVVLKVCLIHNCGSDKLHTMFSIIDSNELPVL